MESLEEAYLLEEMYHAAQERQQPEDSKPEHKNGDGGGQATEAGGSDSPQYRQEVEQPKKKRGWPKGKKRGPRKK